MWRTIVSQTYLKNIAVDASGYSNNGIPIQVSPEYPGFLFNQPGSRISVPPSATLQNLGAIQAAVQFTLQPSGTLRRFNLAEGFESFALFVNPDYSVQGTILDATSTWNGPISAPGVVSAGQTHTAILVCDGVNSIQVFLDGSLVAEDYAVSGSVRSVGSLGIAVGHWPNPPATYTFQGTIHQFILLKYDPLQDILNLLDSCCVDWRGLQIFLRELAARGVPPAQLASAGAKLAAAGNITQVTLRGGTKASTFQQLAFTRSMMAAIRRRDVNALERVLASALPAVAALDPATQAHLSNLISDAFASYGLRGSDWITLMKLLCLTLQDLAGKGCCHGH
jgi:hypothetical protein